MNDFDFMQEIEDVNRRNDEFQQLSKTNRGSGKENKKNKKKISEIDVLLDPSTGLNIGFGMVA